MIEEAKYKTALGFFAMCAAFVLAESYLLALVFLMISAAFLQWALYGEDED